MLWHTVLCASAGEGRSVGAAVCVCVPCRGMSWCASRVCAYRKVPRSFMAAVSGLLERSVWIIATEA